MIWYTQGLQVRQVVNKMIWKDILLKGNVQPHIHAAIFPKITDTV